MNSKNLDIKVFVEIPKGSRNKYEYDEKHKVFRFDRTLFSAVHYPCDYGFIPDTLAEDGDALDALVLINEPTFPGCLIEARPVGALLMKDEKGQDDKILCVPVSDPLWNPIHTFNEVPKHLLKEIEHFFRVYKDLEGKKTIIEGWQNEEAAHKIIQAAIETFSHPAEGKIS